jgi:hypothetical protein
MALLHSLASLSLAAIGVALPVLQAEPRCPGNAESLHPRLVQGFEIVLPVTINQAGPYDFLVDTGTQRTLIDPSLAAELHLRSEGSIQLVGVDSRSQASLAKVDLLAAGSHAVAGQVVEVHDLERMQAPHVHIRGLLGGDFLSHFDVLIDYSRRLVCLDDTKAMRIGIKGDHIALVTVAPSNGEIPLTALLVVSVHLSGVGGHQFVLLLDSGTNTPYLYNPAKYWASGLLRSEHATGYEGNRAPRAMSILPQQTIEIGSLKLQQVRFVSPAQPSGYVPTSNVDGLLATTLFERVFISYEERFVILKPRSR